MLGKSYLDKQFTRKFLKKIHDPRAGFPWKLFPPKILVNTQQRKKGGKQ